MFSYEYISEKDNFYGTIYVNRDYIGMTPSGMKFSTLAGTVGGSVQTPGFIGHSKHYIGSHKFISAEGGAKRIVWMNRALKEELTPMLEEIENQRAWMIF
jgi:acetyl-CoA synthase